MTPWNDFTSLRYHLSRTSRRGVLPLISMLALGVALPTPAAAYDWTIQTVEASGVGGGENIDMAVEANGNVHISYRDSSPISLKYAGYNGSTWSYSTIATGTGQQWSSIDVTSTGLPRVASATSGLKYSSYDGSSWSTVATGNGSSTGGFYSSLKLTSSNLPRISYNSDWLSGTGNLRLASYNGSVWSHETVDPQAGTAGGATSLQLDALDRGRIAYNYYNASTGGELRYAKFNGATWDIETVDSSGVGLSLGTSISMQLDAGGNPHISYNYYDGSGFDVRYAYFDGLSWHSETVVSAGSVGLYTSLVLDANGNPIISYSDQTTNSLNLAVHDGLHWSTSTITTATYGQGATLGIDQWGKLYVVYGNGTDLFLATAVPEPEGIAIGIAALLALAVWRRRWKTRVCANAELAA